MRYQNRIYDQIESDYTRNVDILNVNLSSDISTFQNPTFTVSGGSKIISDHNTIELSGTNFDDIIISGFNNCYSGSSSDDDCFSGLSWSLLINENGDTVYDEVISESTSTANTINQILVNTEVNRAFTFLGYEYQNTGTTFYVNKPYGVYDLSIDLCLDIKTNSDTITGCPDNFTVSYDGEYCVSEEFTGATPGTNGPIIVAGDKNGIYCQYGALFYEDITDKPKPIIRPDTNFKLYDNDGIQITRLHNEVNPFWGNGLALANGRLNNVGVKDSGGTTWHGVSYCLEFNEPTIHHIGLAADNFCRFYINGELIVDLSDIDSVDLNKAAWQVFPYKFEPGKNVIQMEGKNAGDGSTDHSFGFEIYSATTTQEITGATNTTEAKYRWDTSIRIDDYFDVSDGDFGYTCPSGYSLSICDPTPICYKMITTGLTTCNLSGDCDSLCVVIDDVNYNKITSGDTNVHIIDGESNITLTFDFTGNTENLEGSDFSYNIYKLYNGKTFSQPSLYNSGDIDYNIFKTNNKLESTIPLDNLDIDGDYLIKGYYIKKYDTEFLNKLGVNLSTLSINGDGNFGIYNSLFDYYMVVVNKPDTPQIIKSEGSNYINGLNVFSLTPDFEGQSAFTTTIGYVGSPIVSLNGLVLDQNNDYTFIEGVLNISGGTVIGDIITIALSVSDLSSNGLTLENYDISTPIVSGGTNQEGVNKIYYNSDTDKYELFLDTTPNINEGIVLTLNGIILANNIDFNQSTTNLKRIIFDGDLTQGDNINVYYNANVSYVGSIKTNSPVISWVIETPAQNNDGIFTIEVVDKTDTDFNNILYSSQTQYITGQRKYSNSVLIEGEVGDEYLYRVKNEKRYRTINGDFISLVEYSEYIPIKILNNSLNSY